MRLKISAAAIAMGACLAAHGYELTTHARMTMSAAQRSVLFSGPLSIYLGLYGSPSVGWWKRESISPDQGDGARR
jgi:hypothetical protein